MAFYSSRVDESGNEVHRASSAREYTSRIIPSRSHSRSSRNSSNFVNINTYNTVSYVNPAAFVEKSATTDVIRGHHSSGSKSITEISSDIVPRLDLNSEGNSPSQGDLSYSYRKACDVPKKIEKPDAYANWLSAKRKMKSYEAAKKKKAEEEKQQQLAEKRRISEKKFKEWLVAKATTNEKPIRTKVKSHPQPESHSFRAQQPILTLEEAESNRRAWEEKKREDERRRRQMIENEEKQKRLLQEQRKMLAAKSWEKWLSEASSKPKPVPLNQGIFTLKGTISDIFVNPHTWQNPNC